MLTPPTSRKPGSRDPRAAFIFEGIGDDELIGDFPSLVMEYGAAGFELDRMEPLFGTPPHTIHLATASEFSDSYQHVVEEVDQSDSKQGGSTNPLVRSDMVYVPYPKGGRGVLGGVYKLVREPVIQRIRQHGVSGDGERVEEVFVGGGGQAIAP